MTNDDFHFFILPITLLTQNKCISLVIVKGWNFNPKPFQIPKFKFDLKLESLYTVKSY